MSIRLRAAHSLVAAVIALTTFARPAAATTLYLSIGGGFGPTSVGIVQTDPTPQLLGVESVAGMQAAEFLVGIAVRPATGVLYGVGSTARLYRLDFLQGTGCPTCGVQATLVGGPFGAAIAAAHLGVDFDPATDRLRVITDTANLQLDPTNGAVLATDAPVVYAAADPGSGSTPRLSAITYSPNVPGHAGTLYGIDGARGMLVRIGNPDPADGSLHTIGAVPPGSLSLFGLDVGPGATTAFGVASGSQPGLATVDLVTGAATLLGPIGNQFTSFDGLAVAPAAAPTASIPVLGQAGLALLALLILGAAWHRLATG